VKGNKKKVFLVISGSQERVELITGLIDSHYNDPVVYSAPSGNVGLLKIRNAEIDIIIIDSEAHTADRIETIQVILEQKVNPLAAMMIIGHPPEDEIFVDEIVTGKISWIDEDLMGDEFNRSLVKALNYSSHNESASFYLRFLAPGDVLIKEGEKAEFVYILRSGELSAFKMTDGKKVVLGKIEPGEFVGEMAYINNEPRTASIEALADSQLIEVPIGLIDSILYKRPSWTRALVQTLSKRLKSANKAT
jgi:CRP/FNR family cyclic AMP-dependent transcriptional regulator